MDCYDPQKSGAPVLKVEPNALDGFDLRQSDGELVRCEKTASGETKVSGRSGRTREVTLACCGHVPPFSRIDTSSQNMRR